MNTTTIFILFCLKNLLFNSATTQWTNHKVMRLTILMKKYVISFHLQGAKIVKPQISVFIFLGYVDVKCYNYH